METRMVIVSLSMKQSKFLLKLLDNLIELFHGDVPMELTGVRCKLFQAMYPDTCR